MSLAVKYRPTSLKEMIGNKATVKALDTVLSRKKEDIPHAFLFTGLSGGGKTTLARIVADRLGCLGTDFTEINSADFNGIDTIRELRMKSQFAPSMGSESRVWLLDEAHALSGKALEAMLKLLEEAPSHVYFILATTEPEKFKPTVRNRLATFNVSPLTDDEMETLIKKVCKAEKKEIKEEVIDQIIESSNGSARACLSILDTVIDLDPKEQLKQAERKEEENKAIIELCRALMAKKPSWKAITTILRGLKEEPESIRYAVLGYANACLLKSDNPKAYQIIYAFRDNFYDSKKAGVTSACYEVYSES